MMWLDRLIGLNIIPTWLYRYCIRYLISKKLKHETNLFNLRGKNNQSMIKFLSQGPLATHTTDANQQPHPSSCRSACLVRTVYDRNLSSQPSPAQHS